jgi:hypothetical protein
VAGGSPLRRPLARVVRLSSYRIAHKGPGHQTDVRAACTTSCVNARLSRSRIRSTSREVSAAVGRLPKDQSGATANAPARQIRAPDQGAVDGAQSRLADSTLVPLDASRRGRNLDNAANTA